MLTACTVFDTQDIHNCCGNDKVTIGASQFWGDRCPEGETVVGGSTRVSWSSAIKAMVAMDLCHRALTKLEEVGRFAFHDIEMVHQDGRETSRGERIYECIVISDKFRSQPTSTCQCTI
eukprot:COSAG06_NODE_199_length_20418_cov_43.318421_16_plen_119_part_00